MVETKAELEETSAWAKASKECMGSSAAVFVGLNPGDECWIT